jgi:NAD(P)-dependent dehydrogenase (short-subunit alcohol dehydrogenase family)
VTGSPLSELEGRVAAITGGGSGIGAALAVACADAGMDVAIADVEIEKASAVAKEVEGRGRRSLAAGVDVRDAEAVDSFAARTFAELGGCHLLCNNAGVLVMGATHERSLEDWEWIVGVNLFGVIHGVAAFTGRMIEAGDPGHLVNTASINGLIAVPANGAYSTTKYAVLGLSESLRLDLAPHGIGVTALCPSAVKTGILRSDRNRPTELGTSKVKREDVMRVMEGGDAANSTFVDPDQVAAATLEAVRHNEPYVITHPGTKRLYEARVREIFGAFDLARTRYPDAP